MSTSSLAAIVVGVATLMSQGAHAQNRAPDQTFQWGGFYVGGNAGYHSQSSKTTSTYSNPYSLVPGGDFPTAVCTEGCGGGGGGGGGTYGTIATGYSIPANPFVQWGSLNATSNGFAGGFHAGYNIQVQKNFVFGLEGDFTFLNGNKTASAENAFAGSAFWTCDSCTPGSEPGTPYNWNSTGVGINSASTTVDQRWLGTIRARAGVAVDRFMIFGTAGLAFANVKVSSAQTSSYTLTPDSGAANVGSALYGRTTQAWAGSVTQNRFGFAVGAGGEYALTDNWIIRAEYLYYNLGSVTQNLQGVVSESAVVSNYGGYQPIARNVSTKTTIDGSLVRAAVSYKF